MKLIKILTYEIKNLLNAHKLYLANKQKAYQQQYNFHMNCFLILWLN